eukprot:TRINITY_DN2372_c1_g1_i1.p1 TRINITY_DN2372_c1_g1~~TRINITY_DN2372_c1_g1_i1.p1  ORF type:complete len:249 (+),score=59.56 TRINITY_DN2372_c1_g1_i1:12-758(+)
MKIPSVLFSLFTLVCYISSLCVVGYAIYSDKWTIEEFDKTKDENLYGLFNYKVCIEEEDKLNCQKQDHKSLRDVESLNYREARYSTISTISVALLFHLIFGLFFTVLRIFKVKWWIFHMERSSFGSTAGGAMAALLYFFSFTSYLFLRGDMGNFTSWDNDTSTKYGFSVYLMIVASVLCFVGCLSNIIDFRTNDLRIEEEKRKQIKKIERNKRRKRRRTKSLEIPDYMPDDDDEISKKYTREKALITT